MLTLFIHMSALGLLLLDIYTSDSAGPDIVARHALLVAVSAGGLEGGRGCGAKRSVPSDNGHTRYFAYFVSIPCGYLHYI